MKSYAVILILICCDKNKKAFHTLSLFCHALSRLNDGLSNSSEKNTVTAYLSIQEKAETLS